MKNGLAGVLSIFFAAFMFGFGISNAYSPEDDEIPEFIRIGLEFGGSAVERSIVSSKDDISLFVFDGDEDEFLMETGERELEIEKDSCYHIQLEESFDEVEDAIEAVNDMDVELAYPFFDGDGWKVNIGRFESEEEAEDVLEEIEDDETGIDADIVKAGENDINVKTGGEIVVGYEGSAEIELRSSSKEPVSIDGKKYRGGAVFKRIQGSDIIVINRVRFEEYLYGVLPKEMSGTWPLEALKAQAVSARNYAAICMGKHSEMGFDLCDTSDCQVYGGLGVESEKSNRAVDETNGKLMTYDGQIVHAFYHSNSGGHTEDSENVWSESLPYIRGIEDDYSIGAPNDRWKATFTCEEVREKLKAMDFDVGDVKDVRITSVSRNGRVTQMQVVGDYGKKTMQKDSIRNAFGYSAVKSTYFRMSPVLSEDSRAKVRVLSAGGETSLDISSLKMISSDSRVAGVDTDSDVTIKGAYSEERVHLEPQKKKAFVFEGRGWGHGLGMSQWGAKKMAESGYGYEDILKHYYTGVEIEG